jgi:SAM-dependent methyltransferase
LGRRNGSGEAEEPVVENDGGEPVGPKGGAVAGASSAAEPESGEDARASGEGEKGGEPESSPERLFALGSSDGSTAAPLAVVFKRRGAGSGGRRREPVVREADPRADDAELGAKSGESIAATLTPTRTPEPERPQTSEYDVVLTDAYRVARPEGEAEASRAPERPSAPPKAARAPAPDDDGHDDSLDSVVDDTEPSGLAALADLPLDVDPLAAMDAILGLARRQAAEVRERTEDAWYTRLFSGEYLLAHPRHSDVATDAEVEFVEDMLGVARGARLLDLACGYGRHTVRLARRGYEVVGLDLSMDMLKVALTQAQTDSLSIKFVHGDMRDLNFQEVFDGAFCLDTSFGYFSESENLMVLRGLHDALKRGGRLVLDVINRDHVIREIPLRNWWEGDGCLVQEDIEFDYDSSRLLVKRFVVFADGLQREFDISVRLFGLHELRKMLHLVGFEILRVSGSPHTAGAFFGAESRRLLILAEKVDRRRRR